MEPGSPLRDDRRNASADGCLEISGFVLAGGRSRRLGQDKALLPWRGEGNSQTLLEHAIARLGRVCDTVSICADRNDLHCAEIVISDALPGNGPLGGIVAALEQTVTEWNLFLAVDLPFLPIEVFKALVARTRAETGNTPGPASAPEQVACILPQVEGLEQPLCSLYHRGLAPGLRRALEQGIFKVTAALHEAVSIPVPGPERQGGSPVLRIELWDIAGFAAAMKPSPLFDPSEWFLNINTPEDWQRAQQHRFE